MTPADIAVVDRAARHIAGNIAFGRLLEATEPDGWALARDLAALADRLAVTGRTRAWVEAVLPRAGDGRHWTLPPHWQPVRHPEEAIDWTTRFGTGCGIT